MATQYALEPQTPAVDGVRFVVSPRRIAWAFVAIITLITALSVAEQYVIHIMGRDDLEEFLIAVDVDAEANIPTWYASATLLSCAMLLGTIAAQTRRRGRDAGYWASLSAVFVFLSVDETAQLHEHLGRLQSVWHTHGILYFAWVIPGTIVVSLLGLAYLRFVLRLPAATRRRFIWAGLVYVGGALGVEAISGWRAERMGMNNMTHSLIATVEEDMEMAGVAMFTVALLRYMGGERGDVTVDVAAAPRVAASDA